MPAESPSGGTAVAEPGPPPAASDPEARVIAGPLLRAWERAFHLLDQLLGGVLPERLNPFLHTGEVAVTALLVATASGILLLFWYRPSLHQAFSSVAAMGTDPWRSGLLRSLHRYGSDVAMFFTLVHALRVFLERRFAGPRWLAWVTGVTAVAALWFIGWTGYWLVWDTRAHAVAAGTARVLDVLPVFADPMGRSLLVDSALNSLLFFVVFFVHMLVPLLVTVLLLLHLARLARAKWITSNPLTVWTLGVLVALAVAWPAGNAAPAHMTEIRRAFTMDFWYLLPVLLTDRMGGGALWAVMLLGGTVLGTIPWWMVRRRMSVATIEPARCTACGQCHTDCPYDAITMVPRSDGSARYDSQASVDPSKCVGCGICAASCDTLGTHLEAFSTVANMRRLDGWVPLADVGSEPPVVVFHCQHAAGADLDVDPLTGRCAALPGARVLAVPCVGWLHALTIERVLRRGAMHALVVSCGPGQCHYREGAEWLRQRVAGERGPSPRAEYAPADRVHVLQLGRTEGRTLRDTVAALRAGRLLKASARRPAAAGVAATVLAGLLAACVGAASDARYASPDTPGSELVVTFKHPGQVSEHFRELSSEEQARTPIHMRRPRIYQRERADVRMRVTVDGRVVVDRVYSPKGLWHDGNSIAVESLAVPVGARQIAIEIGDSHEHDEWPFRMTQQLEFTHDARHVISFDRSSGFVVH